MLLTSLGCKKEDCFQCTAMKGTDYIYVKGSDTIIQTYLGLQQPPSTTLQIQGYTVNYNYFTIPVNVEYCKPEVDKSEYYTDCVRTK